MAPPSLRKPAYLRSWRLQGPSGQPHSNTPLLAGDSMRDTPYFSNWTDKRTRTIQFCTGRIAISGMANKCMTFVSEINGVAHCNQDVLPTWLIVA